MELQKLPPKLTHGGDWAGYVQEYGRPPLDFSSNVSPLGLPESVRAAAIKALADTERYPDPLCRELRRAIAEAEGVPDTWCLCGSGSADLIYRTVLAVKPAHALLTAPTFAEYEAALTLTSCKITYYPLKQENSFQVQPDILNAITPDIDIVFLCEPNNPTGRTTPPALLRKILERCKAAGALLVADECFNPFLDDPAAHTLCGELEKHANLLILKAFTKLYAMAGLRLGYCLCSGESLLEALRRSGQPWSVSGPAQAAGLAALKETEYARSVTALTRRERPWLATELAKLGFKAVPGEANYLLFASRAPLLEPLRQRGILLRDCGNYRNLNGQWYRAAIRTREENQRLTAALEEIIKGDQP